MNKVSIIIPIYNSEKYLNKCLDSVINQTYKNLEIICVNDGSNDNSLNILKEYQSKDTRIKIIDKKNEGVSIARNTGIEKSSGKYISFVDSDDWLEPNAIETLYNELIKNDVDTVRGNYYINYTCNKNYKSNDIDILNNKLFLTSNEKFGELVIDKLINGSIPCYTVLLLTKKELLPKFKTDIKIMEDKIFYLELMNKIKSIYFINKPLYHYYYNQQSCTKSSEYYIRNMYNLIEVNKYLIETIKKSIFYSEKRIKKINSIQLCNIMDYFYNISKIKDKNELIVNINSIMKNEDMIKLINNSNLTDISIYQKKCIKLIVKKKYKELFIIYKIRYFINKIKEKIKQEEIR